MKFILEHRYLLAVLCILGLGIFLRLYHFNDIPLGLPHDGALEALEAIEISQKPLPYVPYSVRNPWLGETLFRYILAGVIFVGGTNTTTIKLTTTIIGIITLPMIWILTTLMLGKTVAIWGLIFLAFSGWHIIMGKTVWRAQMLPLVEITALVFLFQYLNTKRFRYAILAGLGSSIVINTYNAGRIMPVIVTGIFILAMLHSKQLVRKYIPGFIIFWVTLIICCAPFVLFALKYPDIINSRASYLFVGSRIAAEKSLLPLWENIVRTGQMFTIRAWGDDFFVREPLLDFPVAQFFIIGIFFVILKIRQFRYQAVFLGFICNLIPGLLSSPNGNRDIGVMPFTYIIAAIGVTSVTVAVEKILKNSVVVVKLAFLVIIGLTLWTTWYIYFGSNRREVFGFNPEATIVGNYMKPRISTTDFYLINNYPRDALTFLTYTGGNPYGKHYTWFDRPELMLSVNMDPNKESAFIMFPIPNNEIIKKTLLQKYPSAKAETLFYTRFNSSTSIPVAWMMTVPKRLHN